VQGQNAEIRTATLQALGAAAADPS
jgi:hypothetical protein